jgi:hypothetical protein
MDSHCCLRHRTRQLLQVLIVVLLGVRFPVMVRIPIKSSSAKAENESSEGRVGLRHF